MHSNLYCAAQVHALHKHISIFFSIVVRLIEGDCAFACLWSLFGCKTISIWTFETVRILFAMCFLTNGNVLSPFQAANIVFYIEYSKYMLLSLAAAVVVVFVSFSICYFQLPINFRCCCRFFCVSCFSIPLIVFASLYHHLCQRNKIYELSLQTNIGAELYIFSYFCCCCCLFSTAYCCLLRQYYIIVAQMY